MSEGATPTTDATSTAARTADKPAGEPEATIRAAVEELDRTAERTREAVDRAVGPATPATAAGTAAGASTTASTSTSAVSGLGRASTLDEAAEALAGDLMRIPGIQRFGDVRLADLDASGPRPLRTMWRIARERLGRDYGDLTIGEIIDRYRSGGGGGGVSAGA
jgi:hypothetical protein